MTTEKSQSNNKKPKRILFYETTGAGAGSSISLKLILNHIDRSQFTPILMFGDKGNQKRWPGETVFEHHGSRLDNMDFMPADFNAIWIYGFVRFMAFSSLETISLPYLLTKIRPDLVHINCGQALTMGIFCRLLKIPVVWHIRELVVPNKMGRLQDYIYSQCAHTVVAISKAVAARLPKCQYSKKLTILHNAVEANHSSTTQRNFRDSIGLKKEDFVVLLLGTINHLKGYGFLSEVAANTRLNKKIKYVLAGAVHDTHGSKLKKALRLVHRTIKKNNLKISVEKSQILKLWQEAKNEGTAFFPGYVDAQSAIEAADIVVCPNLQSEPFGRTVPEAYRQSTPVIAMDVEAFNETIQHAVDGYLLPPEPKVWAKTITALAQSPEQMNLLKANAQKSARNFEATQHMDALHKIYKRILKETQNKIRES